MPDPIRILHVEDDEDIVTIVRLCLDLDGGFDVRVARSEAALLDILNDTDWAPHIVLLDVHLGATSGLDMIPRLEAAYITASIVLMTASVTPGQTEAYRRLGAAGVISKPFDPLSLASEIRRKL